MYTITDKIYRLSIIIIYIHDYALEIGKYEHFTTYYVICICSQLEEILVNGMS